MNEDEEFYAWLDGELEGEDAARVAARVAASPELTGRAEQHRKMVAGLRGAFQPVINAAGEPPRFQSADVIDFSAAKDERRRHWFGAPQWAAMAASLALGLVIGSQFYETDGVNDPVTVKDGQLMAAATLHQSLETSLASAPAAEGPRIRLTFRDERGSICRSFVDVAATGLACREGKGWRIHGLFPTADGQEGAYRMAAGEDSKLAALIDETISGEPFDAAQEKAALANNWR